MKATAFQIRVYTHVSTHLHTSANMGIYIIKTNANRAPSGILGKNKDLRSFHGHSYIRGHIDLIGKMHTLEVFPDHHNSWQHVATQERQVFNVIPVQGSSDLRGSNAEARSLIVCYNSHCHETPAVSVSVADTHPQKQLLLPSDLTHLANPTANTLSMLQCFHDHLQGVEFIFLFPSFPFS